MRWPLFLFLTLMGQFLLAQPKAPTGFRWKAVEQLSDEFDVFDTNKWEHWLFYYMPPNIMTESQGYVDDGKLCIRAGLNEDSLRWMKSSRIRSKAKISFPMYTECSMKAADISAYNTYWLNNGDLYNRNEIDICENNANPTHPNPKFGTDIMPYVMQSNIHHAVDSVNLQSPSQASTQLLSSKNKNKGKALNEAYHTLGLFWENERNCHWYLDGEYVGFSYAQRDFTLGLYVIFDLWSTPWDGLPTRESLQDNSRNTMYVDWIHTYQLVKK